jgi:hypothetical protein
VITYFLRGVGNVIRIFDSVKFGIFQVLSTTSWVLEEMESCILYFSSVVTFPIFNFIYHLGAQVPWLPSRGTFKTGQYPLRLTRFQGIKARSLSLRWSLEALLNKMGSFRVEGATHRGRHSRKVPAIWWCRIRWSRVWSCAIPRVRQRGYADRSPGKFQFLGYIHNVRYPWLHGTVVANCSPTKGKTSKPLVCSRCMSIFRQRF